MLTNAQVEFAKTLWNQARVSAQYTYDTWQSLIESQKTFISSYREAGYPVSEMTQQFEKFIQANADMFKASLNQMDNLEKTYEDMMQHMKDAEKSSSFDPRSANDKMDTRAQQNKQQKPGSQSTSSTQSNQNRIQ